MPFTKAAGGIPILLKYFRNGRGLRRHGAVVSWKAVGYFGNATHVHAVMITPRKQGRSRG